MNKTKLAVFCILVVVIMCQMALDAGPSDRPDNTSFRVVNTTQRSAHQRTQASSRSGGMAQQSQQQGRTRGRRNEGQYQYGNRPCKGDRCPSANVNTNAPAPKSSAYQPYEYDFED